jgi:hypothetical protein
MATLNSHPHNIVLGDWYHHCEPALDRFSEKANRMVDKIPCEFLAGMVFLVCFTVGLIYGFNLAISTKIFFILLAAAAGLIAAWAFLFTNHGLLRQIWALSAVAGNLFLINFI